MPGPQSLNTLVQTAAQQYDLLTADLFDSVDEQVIASRAGQHLIAYFCTKIKEQFERGLWVAATPAAPAEPLLRGLIDHRQRCLFLSTAMDRCVLGAGHTGPHMFGGPQ